MIKILSRIVRKILGFPFISEIYYGKLVAFKYRMRGMEDIFTDIYRKNIWKGKNSVSGLGSEHSQTAFITMELPKLFNEFNIFTMLDIPCGDFHWMKTLDFSRIDYTGADIVKDIIRENTAAYQKEGIRFVNLNLIDDKLPKVDLVFCRDCLVHFSFKDIFQALHNICESQSEFLLTTTFTERGVNRDVITGSWHPINLELEPFRLPQPLKIIKEECTEYDGSFNDKALALWRIDNIREILTERFRTT